MGEVPSVIYERSDLGYLVYGEPRLVMMVRLETNLILPPNEGFYREDFGGVRHYKISRKFFLNGFSKNDLFATYNGLPC